MTDKWEELIDTVLNYEKVSVEIPKLPINSVIQYMKNKSFDYELDTNGYQVDFWIEFTKDDEKFTLSGDLWYEDTHSFSKD